MQSENGRTRFLFTWGVAFSLLLGSVCHGVICGLEVYEITADIVLSLLLGVIFDRYVRQCQWKYHCSLWDMPLFVLLFFAVNGMMAIGSREQYGYLWLLPVAMLALQGAGALASAVYIILLLQYLILHAANLSAKSFVMVILYGIICLWLWTQKISGRVLLYLFIIMLSIDGVLLMVQYQFLFSNMARHRQAIQTELGSIVLLELFISGYFLYRRYRTGGAGQKHVYGRHFEKSLEILLEEDYGLLLRLKEYSEKTFRHSMKVSQISARAAEYMGGNVKLAQAGGLYHEIGRVTGQKDYLPAGKELMQENDFPEELIAVVCQHSTGGEKPKSLEAAIVMMTDCIISTSDYLEQTGKREEISDEKLVLGIFRLRIQKGNLAEAGLTEEQLTQLRQFYKEQVRLQDSEEEAKS